MAVPSGYLSLFFKHDESFFLDECQFQIFGGVEKFIQHCYVMQDVIILLEVKFLLLLFLIIFWDEQLIEGVVKFSEYIVDEVITYFRRELCMLESHVVPS